MLCIIPEKAIYVQKGVVSCARYLIHAHRRVVWYKCEEEYEMVDNMVLNCGCYLRLGSPQVESPNVAGWADLIVCAEPANVKRVDNCLKEAFTVCSLHTINTCYKRFLAQQMTYLVMSSSVGHAGHGDRGSPSKFSANVSLPQYLLNICHISDPSCPMSRS